MTSSASPGSFSTPPNRTRRKRVVSSPSLSSSVGLLTENDDAEEKRLRRKSKLLTNNILSPGGVQVSPGRPLPGGKEKRKSINLSHAGMTNVQLKEHYANCIKLSSENKINAKNAFGLHLIDYMKDLLKQSQKEDTGTNFQVASCTLDAGVKIYAYRVDSVHTEAYKVLGSLGRAVDNQENDQDADGDIAEDGSQPQAAKKQKKKATGKTIETNLRSINCEQFDLDFEVDPFFHKTSAAFDEGGTSGLLSFQLKSKSDRNDLMLDSLSNVNEIPTATVGESSQDDDMVDLSVLRGIRDMYDNLSMDAMQICPQFSSFTFSGWDNDSQDVGGNINLPDDSFDDNVHRFDVNAPVVSDGMASFDAGSGDYDGFSDNENEKADGFSDLGPIQFDSRAAQMSDGTSRASLLNTTVSTRLTLSLNPSEYSYFSQDILSTWAGPLHWKVKPKSKEKNASSSGASSKTITKKAQLRIDYEDEIDLKKYFTTGRASTHLKEATLERYAAQMTVLPPDLHYQPESLFKLFFRTFMTIKRQADAKQLENEDDEWYDYNNKNDREGFCPALDYGDDNDYDDDGDIGCSAGDMSFIDPAFQQPAVLDPSAFAGENLVAPPNKVRVLDINYAKSAKRIDIKKLKGAMWKLLCEDNLQEKENVGNNNLPKPVIETDEKEAANISGTYSFKSMYDALPTKVSNNMAKNLSGPIAFVCLLYLANEKTLKLSGKEDMSDIIIEEGI